ncbi:unnamed protein product [Rotaria sp. Silwood2]|nr:unnamed protein product [Rotaria sp. Silwood2]CAF4326726.1 unnamed protein product [Rotaria sp. Silwood2]CAF4403006.1 unnamed protein product [Rotaria sp. Silwood2]
MTITEGYGKDNSTIRLYYPWGLFVDDDGTAIIVDYGNDRIVQWKMDETNGQVIAGGFGKGKRLNKLNEPTDVLIDKETDSLIICDSGNRRVVQWSHRNGTSEGKVLFDHIACRGLAIDDQGYLYISDTDKHEVKQYRIGNKNGSVVAGGHGRGNETKHLNVPSYVFVDRQQAVYVSDNNNHRVMKWNKDAKEGIVIAGGHDKGTTLKQLRNPNGLFVDACGTLYVADSVNNRVMRWREGAKNGTIIVGRNGHLSVPMGLSFDRYGNLYVVDRDNHHVQRFSIE